MIIIYVKMNKNYVKLPRELFGRLSQIVLETIASLNAMRRQKERLIEITVDGKITGDELADFVHIQDELEKISVAVETLQFWRERMLDTGAIDKDRYKAYKSSMNH